MSASIRLPLSRSCYPSGIYATATGLRIGRLGRVVPASLLYGGMAKGTVRRIRKACRRIGRVDLASAPRRS